MLNRKARTIRGEGTNADTETRVRCLSLSFAVEENGDKNTGENMHNGKADHQTSPIFAACTSWLYIYTYICSYIN